MLKGNRRRIICGYGAIALLGWFAPFHAQANGVYGDGVGARSMAMGGADVAWAADPLGAMGVNPAALGNLTAPTLSFGATGGLVQGHFDKSGVSSGDLDESPGALPEGALAFPIPKTPVVLGFSCVPETTLLANWHYPDPPGGLGGATSYGYQQDKSEIIAIRSAFGAGANVTSDFSVGANIGFVYNENWLQSPFIFQNLSPGPGGASNSAFDGAKTLLNLHTSGYGWNAQIGVLYRVTPDLQFGVSYESVTKVTTDGGATGDPSLQFGAPQGTLPFHYDATVKNTFPQEVRAGVSWKFQPQWRLALQMDWIDWADAFHDLPLSFSNGTSPGVNAALGSSFNESIPLNWKSEFVYRAGVEYNATENLVLRVGYCYGNSPVPSATLTPLTAAIMQQTITTGIGYHWDRYSIDAAYQYYFPTTQNIGTSGLLSGEYSNSSIQVGAHTFALTTTVRF
jgi:long-chain fatty acid transport protein